MTSKSRQPEDPRDADGPLTPERTSWFAARVTATGDRVEVPLREVLKKGGLIGGVSIVVAAGVLTLIGNAVRAPKAPTLGPPPQSQLIDVTLPFGSTPMGGGVTPGTEVWHVPMDASDEVANLRRQLPIWGSYEGLPWCSEATDSERDAAMWSWGTAKDMILVDVSPHYSKVGLRGSADPVLVTLSGSAVTITRGPDAGGVCDRPKLPASTIYGDGTYLVGTDIQPGLWRSDGGSHGSPCLWLRLGRNGGGNDAVIASNVSPGLQFVRIGASDTAFRTEHCGAWRNAG